VEEVARQGKMTPLHTHPGEEEAFYILDGQARIYIDGAERSPSGGGFLSVPHGVPHAYLVTSEVARLLILITPGSGTMEAFFREAAEPAAERVPPEAGPLDIERIAAAAERTGAVDILGPPPFGEPGADPRSHGEPALNRKGAPPPFCATYGDAGPPPTSASVWGATMGALARPGSGSSRRAAVVGAVMPRYSDRPHHTPVATGVHIYPRAA